MQKNPTRFTKGNVFIDGDVNPRPHEIETAKALAKAGYKVRFLPNNAILGTADAYINDTIFEFKSPEGSTVRSIERNLVKALNHQSPNIVISTARMKKIQDRSVQSFLLSRLREGKGLQRIILVTRDERAIDINALLR